MLHGVDLGFHREHKMGDHGIPKVKTESEGESKEETKCPIAVGLCLLYRKPNKITRACSDRIFGFPLCCCCCTDNQYTMIKTGGQWQNCFLSLYADSILNFHDGRDGSAPVFKSLKMTDLCRDLWFGEDIKKLSVQYDVPQTLFDSWDGVLAVPDVPYCNSKINWLDFLTQETLNKWLVAICRSIPASTLRVGKYWTHDMELVQSKSVADELKSHIELFFPRKEVKKSHITITANCSIFPEMNI